jgi:uncharacterized protein (DUF427 family)
MVDKLVLEPTAEHPITIEENPNRVVVGAGGRVIADTRDALTLREGSYPPVFYIPLADVNEAQLSRTDHGTYCPYKGDASYFSVEAAGPEGENAVWEYQDPYPAVAEIKGHVAFYADRVEITEERED